MSVLFSIQPKYIDRIFGDQKTVELRTKTVRIRPDSFIWLYATSPRKQIVGYATIVQVYLASPSTVWRKYGKRLGVSACEFKDYVGDSCTISAIELDNIIEFRNPLDLEYIREYVSDFHPPQFYSNISTENKLYTFLKRHLINQEPRVDARTLAGAT